MEHREFDPLDPFPANYPNALGEFLASAAPQFLLRIKAADQTVIEAPTGITGRSAIAIEGRWRYNDAGVERASPGGAARDLWVWVTAADNEFVPGDPGEDDLTDYSFALAITEGAGSPPAGVELSRLVARAVWDGTKFTALDVGAGARSGTSRHAANHEAGASDPIPSLPSPGQKEALAGSVGTPASGNRFVTELDPRIVGLTGTSQVVHVATIGNGVASVFAIDHNLGTRAIQVQVRQTNTPFALVEPDIELTTINQVTIRFGATVPAAGEYTVTILAPGTAIQDVFPAGIIMPWAGLTVPPGWLLCDGAAVSRTTYERLFTAIGVTYGAGNLVSTFNVPNFKGRVPVGQDAGQTEFDTIGETGGAKTHTLTSAQMPSHSHGVTDPGHTHGVRLNSAPSGSRGLQFADGVGNFLALPPAPNDIVTPQTTGVSVQNAGSGQSHNNLQPYQVVNYLIRI